MECVEIRRTAASNIPRRYTGTRDAARVARNNCIPKYIQLSTRNYLPRAKAPGNYT